ncbi:MAG: BspA family leucine-rich repeat surface protein, partial [Candidatus Neomarinimicrobiota bacterium]
EELQAAVDLWVDDNAAALSTYGEINSWDVSLITDMSRIFKQKSTFNDDISNWDVSNVTNMFEMFEFANEFNQDLSSWDVSSVTNMHDMFHHASNFNGDVSSWDVGSVSNMWQMFHRATDFNQDLSSWDVSSVINMRAMFWAASSFNSNISNWDVSSVTDLNATFFEATSFNQDLSSWDVSNVTEMGFCFNTTNSLSDENRCAIHRAWNSSASWTYDWDEYCVGSEVYLPMQESIKAHYPFDGNANDVSGNGFDGELFGQITLTTDRHGNEESAYHFDGSNGTSIVVSENIPLANSSHTISLNIKPEPEAYNGGSHLFGHGIREANSGLHSRFNGGENIHYGFWGNNAYTVDLPFTGSTEWHHLVYTYDLESNIRKIYVDGVLLGEPNTSPAPYVGNGPLAIGGHVRPGQEDTWAGKIDDFIVWDVALTPEQVQQIYTETPPPPVASILVEPTSIQESSPKVFSITNTGDLPLNWSTSPLDTEEEMTFERPDVESIVASINSRGSGIRNNSQILTAANGSRVVERPDDVDIATVYHSQRNGNPLDGALLYSDGESEMLSTKDALLATGWFNTLSVINIGNYTPTLEELSAFETILIWTNFGPQQAGALGDVLADYVDNGGGLVTGMFAMASGWNIAGRFLNDGYLLMTPSEVNYGTLNNSDLTIIESEHPIFAGVEGLVNPGGSFTLQDSPLSDGATLLASYTSGSPLAVTKDFNGTPRVDLVVYPNMSYDQNVGATAQLIANSMAYVAGHAMTVQPEWLSVDPVAGVLEPGTSGDVNIMLDATTLLGGTYQHDLKLFSNDLSNPELIVPVSLEVTELYDVTFKLDLRYQDVSENGVHLAGSFRDPFYDNVVFNDYPQWDSEGIDMLDEDGDGIYEVTLTLKSATYEFKYINGNTWDVGEASVDSECSFGEDGNRQVQVQGDLVLEPVCFNSCIPCQSVTDEESFAYIGSFGENLYY